MLLLAGFYQDSDPRRRAELRECLRRNADNPHIAAIHLFVEEHADLATLAAAYPELSHPKLCPIAHGRRLTYQELFAHANAQPAGQRVIIANADIFFDETLAALDGYDLAGRMLCLSRWDVNADGGLTHFAHAGSQDAWIFQVPVPAFPCAFNLGVLGCDNRLAHEAAAAGLLLSNPSLSVHACHLHRSGVRRYHPRRWLRGPVRAVPPAALEPATPPAPPPAPAALGADPASRVYALTSLSPAPHVVAATRAIIASWRAAGLEVRAFNHPDEIPALADRYDVAFVPVTDTAHAVFGRHFVPINAMLRWAAAEHVAALLINADISLRLAPWELKRLRWLADDGLCYFTRYNHEGRIEQAQREPYGIDAFLLHGRHAAIFPDAFMSMGQPFWDYWVPHTFAAHGRPIFSVEFPAAFHRNHPLNWSWEHWHRCALEFARVSGESPGDGSYEQCVAMSLRVRQRFDQARHSVPPRPPPIRDWVERTFAGPGPKLFLELGAHTGSDTAWLAAIPGVRLHAFEPDPRNHPPAMPNLTLHRAAIAAHDGRGPLVLSAAGWGMEWTHSSSIRRPKGHLRRYPVTFGDAVEVELVALDSFARRHNLGTVDFIWADIQGAEGDLVRGGAATLRNTRYLYTEYSDDELYEGQSTLAELLAMLPDFQVIELWKDDVLLKNRRLP